LTEWFAEKLFPHVRQTFEVSKIIFRERTEHQDLVIFENPTFGRVLALDDVIQVTERDEYVYHEMMTHVPIIAHGRARRVLVIGGGDGGILREALRHKGVQKVTLVEIDRFVVDLCLEHMPSIPQKAFKDKRTELVIADGAKFVAEAPAASYDVIIVDSTDPQGPGEVLFTETFYKHCRRLLTKDGILVNQNGVPFMQGSEVTMTYRRRRKVFADVGFYVAPVPTYYGGFMTLGWASPNKALRNIPLATVARRLKAAKLKTKYYSPEIHKGAFALPAFVQALVK